MLLESPFGWRWYLGDRVTRQSLGLPQPMTPGLLPPRALHTHLYTRAEVERYTQPMMELDCVLRPHISYTEYRAQFLAGVLGVAEHAQRREEAALAARGRREGAASAAPKTKKGKGKEPKDVDLPELSWTVSCTTQHGDDATLYLTPAHLDLSHITAPV